jgi:hypothetical protein
MADTIAYKRIDDNTVEATTKKAGKVAANIKIVVAKDGKSMTVSSKGRMRKGKRPQVRLCMTGSELDRLKPES